jgi:hypothetical protein
VYGTEYKVTLLAKLQFFSCFIVVFSYNGYQRSGGFAPLANSAEGVGESMVQNRW